MVCYFAAMSMNSENVRENLSTVDRLSFTGSDVGYGLITQWKIKYGYRLRQPARDEAARKRTLKDDCRFKRRLGN